LTYYKVKVRTLLARNSVILVSKMFLICETNSSNLRKKSVWESYNSKYELYKLQNILLNRYKPLIITVGATGVIIWSMLIWTTSLLSLQILEFFYGTYMAAEVAYYTYIYAKVDKKYYPRVTSHTRAAMFAGKLVSGITSQLMINLELMNYKELNYITLASKYLN